MADVFSRVDIGFEGGQVLSVRIAVADYETLRKSLEDQKGDRWYRLSAQDSEVVVELSRVVYVRLDTDAQRIGF
jgi:hypothetical protein